MKSFYLLAILTGCSSLPTTYRCFIGEYAKVIVTTPFKYEAQAIAEEVRDSMVLGNLIPPSEVSCERREVPQ